MLRAAQIPFPTAIPKDDETSPYKRQGYRVLKAYLKDQSFRKQTSENPIRDAYSLI